MLHQLATHTLALSFFATHYGSLTDDFSYHPNIRNMHMSTLVDDEKREVGQVSLRLPCFVIDAVVVQLVFLYKLVEGVASSSFGTHVANLAGVPIDVIERADVVSKDFARQFKEKIEGKKRNAKGTTLLPLVVQADFAYLYSVATGKRELPVNTVRQREVFKGLKQAVASCLKQYKFSAE